MQANEITLSVDVANSGTTVNHVFTRHSEEPSKTTYRGPDDSLLVRNTLAFYRTAPKRSGNYLGSAKSGVKFTQDVSVTQLDGTTTKAPLIVEVSFSVPVGATTAQTKEIRQRALAILDREDVIAKLMDNLEI